MRKTIHPSSFTLTPHSRRRIETILRTAIFMLMVYSVYFNYQITLSVVVENQITRFMVIAVYGITIGFNLISYYKTCFTLPGYPSSNSLPNTFAPLVNPWFVEKADNNKEEFYVASKRTECTKCDQTRPLRAHHCSVCETCVLRFDHHCPFTANCIGLHNYRFFVCLLYYNTLNTGMTFLFCVIRLIIGIYSFIHDDDAEFINFYTFSFGLVLSCLLFFGDLFMFRFHFKLVKTNSTTLEMKLGGDFTNLDMYTKPNTETVSTNSNATDSNSKKEDDTNTEKVPLMSTESSDKLESSTPSTVLKIAVYDLGSIKYNMRAVLGAENIADMINPFDHRPIGDGEEWEMRMVSANSIPKKGGCQSKKCGHDHGTAPKKRSVTPDSDDDNDMV